MSVDAPKHDAQLLEELTDAFLAIQKRLPGLSTPHQMALLGCYTQVRAAREHQGPLYSGAPLSLDLEAR